MRVCVKEEQDTKYFGMEVEQIIENYFKFDIDFEPHIGQPIQIKNKFYSVCSINFKENYCMCEEIEYKDDVSTDYQNQIICPYCGHPQMDSWEYPENSDDENCGKCNSKFSYESQIERTFSSFKVEKLEPEKIGG